MRFPLLALLALLLITGCDSTEDTAELSADFVVGTWTFASLSDNNGGGETDRTAAALNLLDSFQIVFASNGRATITADLSDAVNAGGSEDLDVTVDYSVGAETLTLGDITVDADVRSSNSLDLEGSGQRITELLGLDLVFDLNENATLELERQ